MLSDICILGYSTTLLRRTKMKYDPNKTDTNEAIAFDVAQDLGYDDFLQMAEALITESSAPTYCFHCGELGPDAEQDATEAYCDYCWQKTCVSALVLGGLI